jgi:hypothetical protein
MATAVRAETKVFLAGHVSRICMFWTCGLIGGANGILGLLMLMKLSFVGAVLFGFTASMMLFLAVHSLSVRVEIGPMEIAYQSVLGRKALQLREVESALPSSFRGVAFLTIKAGRKWISCSTYTFSTQQLSEMQNLIQKNCQALSRSIATHISMSEKDLLNFAMIYLLTIIIVGAGIILFGIHHLHSRGVR